MTGAAIFRLVLLMLVFLAWALLAYRAFAVAASHEAGLGAGLKTWLRSPETKRDRSTLSFLTLVLAAMLAMRLLLPAG